MGGGLLVYVIGGIGIIIAVIVWGHRRYKQKEIQPVKERLAGEPCQCCNSVESSVYHFYVLKFIGIPFLCLYRLSNFLHSLCPEHARQKSLYYSRQTALLGYWGFPGCLASMWYIGRNVLSLRKNGALTSGMLLKSIFYAIILGWLILLGTIVGLFLVVIAAFHIYDIFGK
jgi:hypothetical protein